MKRFIIIAAAMLIPTATMATQVETNSGSQSLSNSGVSINSKSIDNTPSTSAPSWGTGNSCALGGGIGIAGPGVGLSLGNSRIDKGCDARHNAAMLQSIAGSKTAVLYNCLHGDAGVADALRSAGLCPAYAAPAPTPTARTTAAPATAYSFCGLRNGAFTVEVKRGADANLAKQQCMAAYYNK